MISYRKIKEDITMLHPLTKDQIQILEDYYSSGLGITAYVKSHGMKVHQLTYLIEKNKRIKDVNQLNEIVKINSKLQETVSNSSPIIINIDSIKINIEKDFDEMLLTKVIKVCKDATRF